MSLRVSHPCLAANRTSRHLKPTLEGIRNNETFNVMAGLLKPEEALKSFDGLFTDKYVK